MASSSVRLTRTGAIVIATGLAGLFLYSVAVPLSYRFFEEKISMKDLLSVSVDLARKGGDRVKAIREDPSRIKERVKGETKEGAKELMTAADLESHRIMHGGLSKAFPKLKVAILLLYCVFCLCLYNESSIVGGGWFVGGRLCSRWVHTVVLAILNNRKPESRQVVGGKCEDQVPVYKSSMVATAALTHNVADKGLLTYVLNGAYPS